MDKQKKAKTRDIDIAIVGCAQRVKVAMKPNWCV
jgi:hypothetical protein